MTHAVDDERAEPAQRPEAAEREALTQARLSHATLRYTTLRLAIFVVALGLLWLVRVGGVLLVALAMLVSGLASYAVLRPQRDAMSAQLAAASARRRARSAARAAREDESAAAQFTDAQPADEPPATDAGPPDDARRGSPR